MPRFVDAIVVNPSANIFRITKSDHHPSEWVLDPLAGEVLTHAQSDPGWFYLIKALNIRPDGAIVDCYMDMVLPERINDYAYFVESNSLRFAYSHEFPEQVIPAIAIDCFGLYEQFYCRNRPQIGIEVLQRGLAIASRKEYVAIDLAYIFRDERRFPEAIEMFELVVEHHSDPSSFIYSELADAYAEVGDSENQKRWEGRSEELSRQEQAEGDRRRRGVAKQWNAIFKNWKLDED